MDVKQNTKMIMDKNGKPERVGLLDSFWTDTLVKWREQGYLKDIDQETGEEIKVDPAEYFGFDIRGYAGWFNSLPRKNEYKIIEETNEWKITRDGAGAVFKNWKHKSGVPEHIDFEMTDRGVWEKKYRPYLLEVDRERLGLDHVRILKEKWDKRDVFTACGDLFIWELLRKSLGDVMMFQSLILDQGWIHDFNRVYTDFYKAHYKVIFDEIGVADGVWIYEDLGYRNGLFCSPKLLDELIFPYYREMVDFFHSYGMTVVLHTCGYIEEALPLIVDAGFDGLNPMEVKAGCDALKFAEKYGEKLAFIGGLDMRVLESKDRELIRKEIIKLINGMKERQARYIFCSDHSISTNVDFKDFEYAVNVYKDNMYY